MHPRPLFIVGLLLSCTLAGVLTGCHATDSKNLPRISLGQLKPLVDLSARKPKALLLIDAREKADFEKGHLPGARNFDESFFSKTRDPRIEQFEIVVAYGDDADSSEAKGVVRKMVELDHSDARFFAGGLESWKRAKLPLETGPGQPLPEVSYGARQ
ncbi:MAG: rhodanese-like domain-containing protein [Phycisphaerales bacterium]|nr:rhodanese-like domain-containing protein [Planctomycetota bacterium]